MGEYYVGDFTAPTFYHTDPNSIFWKRRQFCVNRAIWEGFQCLLDQSYRFEHFFNAKLEARVYIATFRQHYFRYDLTVCGIRVFGACVLRNGVATSNDPDGRIIEYDLRGD